MIETSINIGFKSLTLQFIKVIPNHARASGWSGCETTKNKSENQRRKIALKEKQDAEKKKTSQKFSENEEREALRSSQ